MPDVVVTRVQRSGPPRRSRNLEERVWVRFPSLYRRLAALAFRLLSPRSRLRRAALRRVLLSGWASFDRRDFELNLLFFTPDAEFDFPSGLQTLGLGEEGLRAAGLEPDAIALPSRAKAAAEHLSQT
jgi:hypothetical protein